MLCNKSAGEDSKTHAQVPRGHKGTVGCAALVVVGKVYHHILKRRPHMSVAQADKQKVFVVNVKADEIVTMTI